MYEKWIVIFSLFIGFIIAKDYQGYPWSQSNLCQYDARMVKVTFSDLQTTVDPRFSELWRDQ